MHASVRRCTHDFPVITVTGGMLVGECSALRALVISALETAPEALLLDLDGVTAVDSSGVVELNHARKQAGRLGARLVLVSPSAPVMRLLQRLRLDTVFSHTTSVDAAVGCCRP